MSNSRQSRVGSRQSAVAGRQSMLPLEPDGGEAPDAEARRYAVDPSRNVVLEASAGTGKTRVLVERYVNLLRAGVDPDHILAITFTRKAATEMRQRIIQRLRDAHERSELGSATWRTLRERLTDISISTIDAFCLTLVREFPLEADVDPGFRLADETEVPRLVDEALDRTLRIGRHLAHSDEDVTLVYVQLGERRLRSGLAALVDRRLVARDVLRRFLASGPRDLTAASACRRAANRLRDVFVGIPRGLQTFLDEGPQGHPQFALLAGELVQLTRDPVALETREQQAAFRGLVDRLRAYFLTQSGAPRKSRGFSQSDFKAEHCGSHDSWRRHRETVEAVAPAVVDALTAFRRDLNVVVSRGVWRLFGIAGREYRRTLDEHAVLDFSEVLSRALDLLRQMEEFSRSRFRLESRYHHVLVDEMQDTSRAQWELVSLLVRSWGEGLGAASGALAPSIFIVGDRKQSIYGFRDADVTMLEEAGRFVDGLRADGGSCRAIAVSFRAAPQILAFVNDVFGSLASGGERRDGFRYDERDRFPVDHLTDAEQPIGHDGAVHFLSGATVEDAAEHVALEARRLIDEGLPVRDRQSGLARAVTPSDIAILFRSRDSHRAYESALERAGLSTYVYKGLGFFDADEIQDAMVLLRFLADPLVEGRTAAFLRSRFVRLSDAGVMALAPHLSRALLGAEPPAVSLDDEDARVLAHVRTTLPRWLGQVDRVTPAELLDLVVRESAYAYEMRGTRRLQARENLKKLRAMIRRIQNRGYATLARIADHLTELAVGDESNAIVDAQDAVSLMTVHAAKGLEFPVVFVVNLGRGTGGRRAPIRIVEDGRGDPAVAIGDFESEADLEALAREREETKRLLYVALTRARDRLYLSGVVKEGRLKPGRGSLGEVLPGFVVDRIEAAATGPSRDQ